MKEELFTIEFRIENLEKKDYDKIITLLKEFDNVKYKEISKREKTIAERTSV